MVDVSMMHLYAEGQVRSAPDGPLVPGAVGDVRLTIGGDAIPIYDINGDPMARLTADGWGISPAFWADTGGSRVRVDFGSYVFEAYPVTALEDATKARQALAVAQDALVSADTAVKAAQAAAASVATASMSPEQVTATVKQSLLADPNFIAQAGSGAATPLDISTSQALAAYAAAKAV